MTPVGYTVPTEVKMDYRSDRWSLAKTTMEAAHCTRLQRWCKCLQAIYWGSGGIPAVDLAVRSSGFIEKRGKVLETETEPIFSLKYFGVSESRQTCCPSPNPLLSMSQITSAVYNMPKKVSKFKVSLSPFFKVSANTNFYGSGSVAYKLRPKCIE